MVANPRNSLQSLAHMHVNSLSVTVHGSNTAPGKEDVAAASEGPSGGRTFELRTLTLLRSNFGHWVAIHL